MVETSCLKDLCEVITKGTTPTSLGFNFADEGVGFLRVQNIAGGTVNYEQDTLFIDEAVHQSLKRSQILPGDVLLSIAGTIGRTGIVPTDAPPLNCNQAVAILRPTVKVDRPFLRHWLESSDAQSQMRGAIVKGTIQNLSLSQTGGLRIPLPPLTEQRRIAAILDQADALRAKRREALAQLDSLTQSIFIEMFGDPITNPHEYPVTKLIDLVDRERPISYGILMPGANVADGIRYVRVVDMKGGGIELSNIRRTTQEISNSFRRSVLKPGDLLMSIRGHVGRFAVVPKQLEGANITQDTARLAIIGASSIYVREALRSIGFQRWMATHTKGVAVRGINLGDVKLMPIPVPPLSVQKEFANRASLIEKLIADHRKALGELDSLFATLQHRAFRGEL